MSSQLPSALLASLEGLPGYDAGAFHAVHASGRQVTSIRINPAKPLATLPAGATHRSDGRGVDVDAGQGVCCGGATIAHLGA